MLLIDLSEKKARQRSLSPAVQLSLLSFLVLGLFAHHATQNRVATGDVRPLEIEEQEQVLYVFERLEGRTPELDRLSRMVTKEVENDSLATVVDSGTSSKLVRPGRHALVFSKEFFDADSEVQEKSLVQLLTVLNPHPGSGGRSGEVAFSK